MTLTATNDIGSDAETRTVTVSAEPTPPGGNLVVNGGFEVDSNGDTRPDGWTSNAGFTRSNAVTAQEGAFVGQHATTANNGWNTYQQVDVTAGETYSFAGRVNIPTTADRFKFQVRIQWRGSSKTVELIKKYTDDTGGSWELLTDASLVAPAGATSARIQMVPASLNGTIYVDDFAFGLAP